MGWYINVFFDMWLFFVCVGWFRSHGACAYAYIQVWSWMLRSLRSGNRGCWHDVEGILITYSVFTYLLILCVCCMTAGWCWCLLFVEVFVSSRRSQEGCRPVASTTSVTQSIQQPSSELSKYLAFHSNQKVKLVTVVLNSWRAPGVHKKVVNLPPARPPLRKSTQQSSSES